MSDDPLDDASSRLFAAVRTEPIPQGAERRVLERARREQRTRAARHVTQLLCLAAAFALVAAFIVRRREPASAISAEPSLPSARRASNHAAAEPPPVPVPASAPRPPPSAVSPKPRLALSAANAAPLLSLDDELSRLKAAENALNTGDAQGALAILNQYDAAQGQRMRAEATLLRIEALARSGQRAAASALAESFTIDNPGSPLVDRARSFILKEEHDE